MSKFIPIQDVVKDLCLRSGDILQRNKGLYLNCAKDVFIDMNLTTLKMARREIFKVNKRLNCIELPCSALQVSSVNLIHGNCFIPVFQNESLHGDLVEVGAAKNCACEYECGHKLCNTVKGYEAVTSVKYDKLPNGNDISFTCVDRKAIDSNGFFYSETQYPIRVYTNGVWTNTVLHTESKKLCKLEVDGNGCVCDTDENLNNLCNACGISSSGIPIGGDAESFPDPKVNTWIYHCNSKFDWFSSQCGSLGFGFRKSAGFKNVYNIDDSGNRIILPHNFGADRAMVRFYEDINLKNIQVPFIAKQCFMSGLQYFASTNNDNKQKISAVYEAKYSKQKFALELEMNKYRIEELRVILTPHVKVPSYIDHRADRNYPTY